MRNSFLKTIASFSALFFILSCSTDADSTAHENNSKSKKKLTIKQLINDPALIGQIHNEEMDNMYTLMSLIKEGDLNTNGATLDQFVIDNIVKKLNEKIDFEGTNIKTYYTTQGFKPSDNQKLVNFTNELAALTEQDLTITSFQASAKSRFVHYKSLANDELYQLSLAITYNISISSFDYWITNHSKWESLATTIKTKGGAKPGYGGRIAKADLIGAGTGAIRGGFAGAAAGGIGAVPGALVGGLINACVSSSAAGIREHLGYTTWWPF